ncbi:Alpha/beta-hydrolase domain-containing protein isoform 2 [Hibiscus syriacus]|uniref:Alpha/beta-hydrolase domain-containing protein isoform 2 n=1 Tax=Hibiscus syriacus TaxID=106335 RepID=A0A6A2XUB2_HIBSY|nr:Alpha/beta-hydrolase domain-containing protein isoform 2 [Hibiscus syriacus]
MVRKPWMVVEKGRRIVRTAFFMVAMLASLLASSLQLLVAIGDIVVPFLLLSSFTCLTCNGFKEHFRRYAFKNSLTDIPPVSILRSIIIICVYSMCDAPALSYGPYLGTVSLCSFVSILVLSVKACVFTVNSQVVAETWTGARRKLLFHRVDPEAVLLCKNVFSSFQKVPRFPTPALGKTPKSDGETRRKPFGQSGEDGELPIRLLADVDSLFITLQGLTIHYKLCFPGSHPRALSSNTSLAPKVSCMPQFEPGKLKLDRQALGVLSKTQYRHHQRSYSNQFHTSSLYAPLLDGSRSTPAISKDIPIFSFDDSVAQVKTSNFNSGIQDQDMEATGQFGIVLVHGFGGGVFSWRHVMGLLACHVACPVAAFDRPGWGLTSRPSRKDWEGKELPNPYKLETQVDLLLSFCSEMCFSSVVLIGHDDGGLLALKAAQKVKASMNSCNVSIKAVVLLSVSLSREVVPTFARILLRTSLGKKHLVRPLLRTEITQVVNRRAWYDATKLTTDVLSLYKVPLCVEGWDEALNEIGRLSNETILSQQNATSLLKAVEEMPVLVITGAEDTHVSLKSSQAMASKLVNSTSTFGFLFHVDTFVDMQRLVAISGCGHLPHEECPKALLAAISPFISRLLLKPELQRQ